MSLDRLRELGNLMIFEQLAVGPLAVNCYVLGDEYDKEAVVIDPGGNTPIIFSFLTRSDLTLKWIINTHGHWDHTHGNAELKKLAGGKIIARKDEVMQEATATPDEYVVGGDIISFGDYDLEVLDTPGHSPGSISLYLEEEDMVFTGDLLFARSVGRTDIPGASQETLLESIKTKILSLPDNTMVLPGHGSRTAIDWEKGSNPFIRGII